MDKQYKPGKFEDKIYKEWEEKKHFEAKVDKNKKPYSIILPPPNANADLHMGHAMYVYEDVMIRYNKLSGKEVLWLPGADHAGFETQFVFEKHLQKQGKSRFDYDRETLFKMIWDFVMENKGNMESQLRKMGFALDWSKNKFTLDEDIVKIVHQTFKNLYDKGLIYRETRLVNYCVKDGTSFSDLEVIDKEAEGTLYFIRYPLVGGGFVTVATTRPETLLGDVAVMVNPKDKRYKDSIGKKTIVPIVEREVPIISDESVDMKFGTGAVKVTPAHDENDFEIAKRNKLSAIQVINFDGKIINTGTEMDGMKIKPARERVLEILKEKNLLEKEKRHTLVAKTCYKCGTHIEPFPLEQWFVKVKPLIEKVLPLIKNDKVKVIPKRQKERLIFWLENFHDWNISRQIVWGIRIPAWKCQDCGEWVVTNGNEPTSCPKCKGTNLKQDEDTFDTWFSSAQWPFATLKTAGNEYFDYFYPTTVMETGYDILPWWVARMLMIGMFETGKEPFQNIFLHGLVRDKEGKKMSKSRGNVLNPMDVIDKYGADALRASLIFGSKEGNDIAFTEEKIVGMRNFTNKIWNIGRFLRVSHPERSEGSRHSRNSASLDSSSSTQNDLTKEFEEVKKSYFKYMDGYRFSYALNDLYEFLWHRFADYYVEQLKDELKNGNIEAYRLLEEVYLENLRMLHPFMPFVTEAIWKVFKGKKASILETTYA